MKVGRILFGLALAGALPVVLSSKAGAIPLPDNSHASCSGFCLRITNDSAGIGAIHGRSTNNFGIAGYSQGWDAVKGSSGDFEGVSGSTSGPSPSAGVQGVGGTDNGGVGVWGRAHADGIGVAGRNDHPDGWSGNFLGFVWSLGRHEPSAASAMEERKSLPYGLADLLRLRPVAYRMNDASDDSRHLGFLAQEVQKVVPELVTLDSSRKHLALSYVGLIPVATRALQEQQRILERQEARIAALEQRRRPLISQGLALGLLPLGLFAFLRGRRKERVSAAVLSVLALVGSAGPAQAVPLPDDSRAACGNTCLTITNDNANGGSGIQGMSTNYFGVSGFSQTDKGAWGVSNTGNGVFGVTSGGFTFAGVYGVSSAGSTGIGVSGIAFNNGYGVRGENDSGDGWAGNFNGRLWAQLGFFTPSDARLKRDVERMPYGLSQLLQLRPVAYRWTGNGGGTPRLGLVAQEVDKVIPEMVHRDGMQRVSLSPDALLPVLVQAIQEQQQMIERREARIAQLERAETGASFGGAGALALTGLPLGLFTAFRWRRRRAGADAGNQTSPAREVAP
jgi:hypothetical protein